MTELAGLGDVMPLASRRNVARTLVPTAPFPNVILSKTNLQMGNTVVLHSYNTALLLERMIRYPHCASILRTALGRRGCARPEFPPASEMQSSTGQSPGNRGLIEKRAEKV